MQKQVFGKSAYSKAEKIRIHKLGVELDKAKKDPKFMDAVREFIKLTT